MKYRDISLYRNNAGKYRIACDYPISPSSTPLPLNTETSSYTTAWDTSTQNEIFENVL